MHGPATVPETVRTAAPAGRAAATRGAERPSTAINRAAMMVEACAHIARGMVSRGGPGAQRGAACARACPGACWAARVPGRESSTAPTELAAPKSTVCPRLISGARQLPGPRALRSAPPAAPGTTLQPGFRAPHTRGAPRCGAQLAGPREAKARHRAARWPTGGASLEPRAAPRSPHCQATHTAAPLPCLAHSRMIFPTTRLQAHHAPSQRLPLARS